MIKGAILKSLRNRQIRLAIVSPSLALVSACQSGSEQPAFENTAGADGASTQSSLGDEGQVSEEESSTSNSQEDTSADASNDSKQSDADSGDQTEESQDSGSAEKETGEESEEADDDSGPSVYFDIPTADVPEPEKEFSFIWICNSGQGTVSKVDTRTLEEQGRFQTRPDRSGSPSRTSVNLDGDVAVLNRKGGVTKIIALPERCDPDKNGSAGLQTSTDSDWREWDDDDCVLWHTPMNFESQRAVAWTTGEDEDGMDTGSPELWVTGVNKGAGEQVKVMRLDGDTGDIVEETSISVPDYGGNHYRHQYGGAVDGNNDFWWISEPGTENPMLHRVKYSDLSHQSWANNRAMYGFTVDSKGRPWACSGERGGPPEGVVQRFDLDSESWQRTGLAGNPEGVIVDQGGCMADAKDRLWFPARKGGQYYIAAVDTESLAFVKAIALPVHVHGVSIDVDHNVWAVSWGSTAYRVEPEGETVDTVSGFDGLYTYSDMTGFALRNVFDPAQ